jgi:hypothetical protein
MRYRGGGVGHLATRQCNKVLLADKHAPLGQNTGSISVETQLCGPEDEDEAELEAEGERDEDGDNELLAEAIHDADIVTAAGFAAL